MTGDLPRGWVDVKLGEVADAQLGKMLDKAKRSDGALLPYLRNINVRWGLFDLNDLFQMPFTDHEAEKFAIRDGDVLVCEGGEPGRSAVWAGGDTEIKFQKALHRVRLYGGIDPRWLVHYLRLEAGRGRLSDHFTGTTIKHFTGEALARYQIPLPPLREQRRIVAQIEALLERGRRAQEALEAIPPLLECQRQAILAAAFRGDLTAAWRAQHPETETAEHLLARLAPADGGEAPRPDRRWTSHHPIPSTWVWASLAMVTEIKGGLAKGKKRSDQKAVRPVPYLRVANVQRGYLNLSEIKEIDATESEIDDLLLRPGDILFNEGGDRDKLGRGWVWEGQIETCIHQNHVFRARPLSPEFEPRLLSIREHLRPSLFFG